MKKKCPNCNTAIEKFWNSSVGAVILGYCPTCKRKVNLGRADGSNGGSGDKKRKKPAPVEKEKKTGKAARAKAASRTNPKRGASEPPVLEKSAKKRSGIGAAIRDFFEY
jgi:hypothetical protein